MTAPGVHPDDMFDGDPTIAAFARDLRQAAETTPPPVPSAALAAVLAGRAPVATYPDVTVPIGSRAARAGWRPARLRLAMGGLVAAAAALVLAAAGALPAPVQRPVARMAEVVGFDLPGGTAELAPATTTTTTTTTIPTTTVVPPPATTVVVVDDPSDDEGGDDEDDTPPSTREPRDDGRDDEDEDDDDAEGRGRGRGGNNAGDDESDEETTSTSTTSTTEDRDDEDDDSSGPGSGSNPAERPDVHPT